MLWTNESRRTMWKLHAHTHKLGSEVWLTSLVFVIPYLSLRCKRKLNISFRMNAFVIPFHHQIDAIYIFIYTHTVDIYFIWRCWGLANNIWAQPNFHGSDRWSASRIFSLFSVSGSWKCHSMHCKTFWAHQQTTYNRNIRRNSLVWARGLPLLSLNPLTNW